MKAPICVGGGKGRDTFVSVLYALVHVLLFLVLLPPSLPPPTHQKVQFQKFHVQSVTKKLLIRYLDRDPCHQKFLWSNVGREAPHSVESQYTVVVFHLHSLEIASPERKSLCIICDFFFVSWHHHQFQASSINTLQLNGTPHTFFQHMLIHFK